MPTMKGAQPQPNPEQSSATEIESVRAQLAEFLRATGASEQDSAHPENDGDSEHSPSAESSNEDSQAAAALRHAVKIKGRQGGVALELGEGDWAELVQLLDARLAGAAGFFRGGQVVLDVHDRALTVVQLRQVARLLEDHEMRLAVVQSTAKLTQESAQELDLAAADEVDEEEPPPEPPTPSRCRAADGDTGTAAKCAGPSDAGRALASQPLCASRQSAFGTGFAQDRKRGRDR